MHNLKNLIKRIKYDRVIFETSKIFWIGHLLSCKYLAEVSHVYEKVFLTYYSTSIKGVLLIREYNNRKTTWYIRKVDTYADNNK